MTPAKNKMQLRAEILSVLNYYAGGNPVKQARFNADVEKLASVEEKAFLAQILFKEIFSDNRQYADVCANIAFSVLDKDVFLEFGIKFLEDKTVTDAKKFYFISLLEHKGIKIDYENLDFYIKDASKAANEGIKEFLGDAVKNPESRIDLLDFYSNISHEERLYLIDNLANEYTGDNLANAFSVLSTLDLDYDEAEIMLNFLLQNDSYYSYRALLNIIKSNKVKKATNKIKIRTFLKNAELKYKNKPDDNLLGDSAPYKCYISFVDGNSDFSLIFSRKYSDNSIVAFFTTINLSTGITSCIGFYNIDDEYFNKIFKRLFTDSIPTPVIYYTVKALLEYFECKNIENNELPPYEFQVWNEFTGDIDVKNLDIIHFFKTQLQVMPLDEIKFGKILKSKLIENWYFAKGQNATIDEIIKSVLSLKQLEIASIDDIIKKNSDKMLKNNAFVDDMKLRLIIQAYVSFIAKFTVSSSVLYSVCCNEKYFNKLTEFLIYKSVYAYFLNNLNSKEENNIFKKEKDNSFTKSQVKKILKDIENKFE